MEYERKIQINNGVFTISIPIDVARYLDLKEDSIMVIQDEEGKKGKYISAWKKKGR